MDALSALKFVAPQQLTPEVQSALQDLSVNKQITAPELQTLGSASAATATQSAGSAQPAFSFQNVLGNFVNEVSEKQAAAGDAVNGLLSGQNVSLHQAVISMEEASVSFQMMVEVRNKLLDSYQELMRMQV
jgi:flagellar hook-basal body complex protein FliE